MTDNPFVTKTATLSNKDVDADELTTQERNEASDDSVDAVEVIEEQAAIEAVAAPSRRVVKRRIVRQVDLKHVAQDMIGHGIANVLSYWHEDEVNRQKLEELGVSREDFAVVLLKQADRAAKSLGFEQAWQN